MNIETLLEKAQQGDASAKAELRARAQNGEAAALWAMGEMYAAGQGLPQNADKAAECFRRAAEQGHEKAQEALARMADGDGEFEALLDKAKQGDEQALEKLLDMLREEEEPPDEKIWDLGKGPEGAGVFGSERYNRVLEAFQEKVEEGDALAQYAVGCLHYQWGRFYESANPDASQKRISWWQESYDLLTRAARSGHADASYLLGEHAYSGLGCSDNREYAGQCYYDAAEKGHEAAFKSLCEVVEEIFDDEDDDDVLFTASEWMNDLALDGHDGALNWYRERAENGDEDALEWLTSAASDHESERALRVLVEMADAGHEGAQEALQTLGEVAGAVNGERREDADDDEKPRHEVAISRAFHLGKYPVTQAQWRAVMGENPSDVSGPDCPVGCVSWEVAQEFIAKLNAAEGHERYRLPTEAEWEYACRAGSETKYSFGDDADELGNYAWYDDNSGNETHPVGQKQPNAWGLRDMHGNVMEWVQDWYGEYSAGAAVDPQGPDAGELRVLRGGSWRYGAGFCRSGFRVRGGVDRCDYDFGFRLALSLGH